MVPGCQKEERSSNEPSSKCKKSRSRRVCCREMPSRNAGWTPALLVPRGRRHADGKWRAKSILTHRIELTASACTHVFFRTRKAPGDTTAGRIFWARGFSHDGFAAMCACGSDPGRRWTDGTSVGAVVRTRWKDDVHGIVVRANRHRYGKPLR